MKTKLEFIETQKFTQWWLWAILLLVVLIPAYGIYKQEVLGETFGTKPTNSLNLGIMLFAFVLLLLLFWRFQLKTRVNMQFLEVEFRPFVKKRWSWDEIKSAEVINYGFVGGWGIRIWTRFGTVYNIKGNKGLFLTTKKGKKYCIGTQKEADLQQIVHEINRKIE
ncbi:MAG: hypothetical protein ACJAY8_001615 [Sphingobacteriales bacterium]|jgi:hypothetical protein